MWAAGDLIGVESYCKSLGVNETNCDRTKLVLAVVDSSTGGKYTYFNMIPGGSNGQSWVRGDMLSTGKQFDSLVRPWWATGEAAGQKADSQFGNSAITGVYNARVFGAGSLMFSLVQPFYNSSNTLQGVFYADVLLSDPSFMFEHIMSSIPSPDSEVSVMDDQGTSVKQFC